MEPMNGAQPPSLQLNLSRQRRRTSGRQIQLMFEVPDDNSVSIGFDHLDLIATSDDHKIALNRLAKIVNAYLRSGAVRFHFVRARIGPLENFAIGTIGLYPRDASLSVRHQPPNGRKGQRIEPGEASECVPICTLKVGVRARALGLHLRHTGQS